jgi:hypothetical protein
MAGALYFHTSHSDPYRSVVSLDHLVGAQQHRFRNYQIDRSCRFEIDRQHVSSISGEYIVRYMSVRLRGPYVLPVDVEPPLRSDGSEDENLLLELLSRSITDWHLVSKFAFVWMQRER